MDRLLVENNLENLTKDFETFLPQNWREIPKNLKIYNHSKQVAEAAFEIASRSKCLDALKAYKFGLFHDIGKFLLSVDQKYKHPRIGYEMMHENPAIAKICITHGFPDIKLFAHIMHYCQEDEIEAYKVFQILQNITVDDYVELIQLCDKISASTGYVTIESKLRWYLENYNIPEDELVSVYKNGLNAIKEKFNKMIGLDIYELLNVQDV